MAVKLFYRSKLDMVFCFVFSMVNADVFEFILEQSLKSVLKLGSFGVVLYQYALE